MLLLWVGGVGGPRQNRFKRGFGGVLINEIMPALENLELPYLKFCSDAVKNREYEELMELNEEISAGLTAN